jgi:hypothetical protein
VPQINPKSDPNGETGKPKFETRKSKLESGK